MKMYFSDFPIFPSVSAMLKSALQIQKASAEQQPNSMIIMQLYWRTKGRKPNFLGGKGLIMMTCLGGQFNADVVHSNSIFLRFKPRIESIETVFKAAISRGERRDQRTQLEKMACCAAVRLLCYSECAIKGVGSAVCPFHGASSREYSWIQFQKRGGGGIYWLLDTALFFLV